MSFDICCSFPYQTICHCKGENGGRESSGGVRDLSDGKRGFAHRVKPPKLLVPGDVVRIEIEGIGQIENAVIEEPAETARVD